MLFYIIIQFSVLMLAITIHEFAHGYVAYKLGDPTAKYAGRLSMNPLRHIDPFGTILLPLMLVMLRIPPIGWARPVPVNYLNLKNPKRDMLWVGLAGPCSNFITALVFTLLFKAMPMATETIIGYILLFGIIINAILGVFNLIPIPPLDGSQIAISLLPWRHVDTYNKLQPYGFIIILILLWSGLLRTVISLVVTVIIKYLGISPSLF